MVGPRAFLSNSGGNFIVCKSFFCLLPKRASWSDAVNPRMPAMATALQMVSSSQTHTRGGNSLLCDTNYLRERSGAALMISAIGCLGSSVRMQHTAHRIIARGARGEPPSATQADNNPLLPSFPSSCDASRHFHGSRRQWHDEAVVTHRLRRLSSWLGEESRVS